MSNLIEIIEESKHSIIKIVFSQPEKFCQNAKATLRPIKIKGREYFQLEEFRDNKAFHTNIKPEELKSAIQTELDGKYKQVLISLSGKTLHCHKKGDGNYKQKTSENQLKKESSSTQNREKEYIFREGENIPALVELGVFTKDFKIIKDKYDKFKQINRFIEIIDDEFKKSKEKSITILDFGCGKSYLTFILYYYFAVKRGMTTKIIGYDLKKEVVENCNMISEKYGYENLKFVVSDVSKDTLYDENIDMIVTLHACDTATDYALDYAVRKNVKYIFSVPCCQHEVNLQIKKGGDLDILLKYGLIKERVSALLTDSIRASILEDMGYKVDLIEFIDFAHSPKNIMIRAEKTGKVSYENRRLIDELQKRYGFTQKLNLLTNEINNM